MITVKFFGLISVDNNVRHLLVNEGKVSQVLNEVRERCPGISEHQLMQAVMIINNKQIYGSKRFSMMLKDGDELVLLSPSSGG